MNTKTSVPVPTDTTPTPDPIAEAERTLRQDFERRKQAHKQTSLADAAAAFEKSEAERRAKFIHTWMSENYVALRYAYSDASPEDLYRISLPYDNRIDALIAANLYPSAVQCWVYRHGGKCSLSDLKAWLKQYDFPVDGDENITTAHTTRGQYIDGAHTRVGTKSSTREVVHAEGISGELKALLRRAGLTVDHGTVLWVVRYRGDTPILASHPSMAEDFPSDQY